jgi:hypothetical protein
MTDLTFETTPQTIEDGWLVVRLEKIVGHVELQKDRNNSKSLRAYIDVPQEKPILIAIQMYGGAGTQPENTNATLTMQDVGKQILTSLETAITDTYKTTGDW